MASAPPGRRNSCKSHMSHMRGSYMHMRLQKCKFNCGLEKKYVTHLLATSTTEGQGVKQE